MIYVRDYDIYFNIFICLVDMLIITELRERVYGKIERLRAVCLLLSAALAAILMLILGIYESSFFILPASLILLPFYPRNFKKKLLFETCLLSITFSYMLLLNDVTNMIPRFTYWGMAYIIFFHAGLWCILFLCIRLCTGMDTELPPSLWVVFLLIPVSTIAGTAALIPLLGKNTLPRPTSELLHLVVQFTFLFIDIVLLVFLKRFAEYFQNEKERRLLEQQLSWQEKHYRQLIRSSEQIQKIWHDMKNHFRTAALLYDEDRTDELREYLKTAADMPGQPGRVISTGNVSFDAILNIKLSEMREKGISCAPSLSIPRGLELPFSDTVVILGNLLDNAAAACLSAMEIKGQDNSAGSPPPNGSSPAVILSAVWQQGTLLIHMENPCADTEKKPYGIGMKNVEETVRKHFGTLKTKTEDGQYVTDIILYDIAAAPSAPADERN